MLASIELAIIVANIALCLTLNRQKVFRSYPRLYSYAFFQLFASITSLMIYWVNPGKVAFAAIYYVLIFLGHVLAFLCAAELLGKLLGPQGALPAWVNTRLMSYIGMGIAAALTVATYLMFSSYGKQWGRVLVTVEQWNAGSLFVTFGSILVFWRTLRVFRRQTRAASICFGFVLYFTVMIIAVFLRGHREFIGMAQAARTAEMLAFLAMMLWWNVTFILPAEVFVKSTPEQRDAMFTSFKEAQKVAAELQLQP